MSTTWKTHEKFPVLEAYSKLRRELTRIGAAKLKPVGLGLKQMVILYRLIESPRTMTELTDYAQSDKASTTRTVEALARAGLVRRRDHGDDRRKRVIQLTAKGQQKAKRAEEVRNSIGECLDETLTAQERKTLTELLGKVVASLAQKREE
jgi:DNA-binding MarR family transcriptional regulator